MNKGLVQNFALLVVAGATATASTGCRKSPSESSPAANTTVSGAEMTLPATTAPSAPPPAGSADGVESLFGARFRAERESRPHAMVTVEKVHDAFRAAGIELQDVRQHLARPFEAKYCVGAKVLMGKTAEETIGMSVCEFADEAEGAKGLAAARKLNVNFKQRETHLRKGTTLTVLLPTDSPKNVEMKNRLVEAFLKAKL